MAEQDYKEKHTNLNLKIDDIKDELIEMGFMDKDIMQSINEVNVRLSWKSGSQCLVYSRSKQIWTEAQICDVFVDESTDQEWLTVKYNDNITKKNMQRFNQCIRSIDGNEVFNKKIIQIIINKLRECDDIEEKEDDYIEYIPSDADILKNESDDFTDEKILYGKFLNDRRHKIISSKDKRVIVECIGLLLSDYGDTNAKGNKVHSCGTGTVFDYDEKTKNVYVVTCAHNIVKVDIELEKFRSPLTTKFQRRITFENKEPKMEKEYECFTDKNRYHKDYIKQPKGDPNDLAVLVFKDDGFYEKIFKNDKNVIQLISANSINEEKIYEYSIYGFPSGRENYSKVSKKLERRGEMWGMTAPSKSTESINNKDVAMYVRTNKNKTMFFYNAIDSEGGQSGSAIFIDIGDKYEIFGIHTGGSKSVGKNWGVALNDSKLKWIQSVNKL